MIYIVMGVSGCGKTTVGKKLAQQLALSFYDADDFHPQVNIDKMASGTPLQDEDRWPWLDILKERMVQWVEDGGAVLACSALKEEYRERLFDDPFAFAKAKKNFIYLKADFNIIAGRLSTRENHFFDSSLLQSQFDTLEEPKYGVVVDASLEVEELILKICAQL